MSIPFNFPSIIGNEEKYLIEALRSGKWAGRGPKTLLLEKMVKEKCQVKHAFFVTSCSSALEVGCLLAQIKPGDEVIIPSFGFVSAANAVLVAGGKPVFAEIDLNTWNITRKSVEQCITSKTRAIMPVHYAGSTAGIDEIRDLCKTKGFFLIEDAAQSLGAKRNGQPIGSTPWALCFSLHDTKNVTCGEGGLICTDNDDLASKIEIIIEKGTNRQRFFRGQVDKYTWVERGASYIASDLLAAIALGQMEKLEDITQKRLAIYNKYKDSLSRFTHKIIWQKFSPEIEHNGHIAAFLVDPKKRDVILTELKEKGVSALFHYIPLHDAPYAKEKGFTPAKELPISKKVSDGLVRLPLFYTMTDHDVDQVLQITTEVLEKNL